MSRNFQRNIAIAMAALLVIGCQAADDEASAGVSDASAISPTATTPGLVTITATDYAFQAPSEIPAGWTTFEFVNAAPADHFALITRVPEGIGVEDYRDLAKVAQNFLDGINEAPPTYPEAGFELAGWYSDVQVMGGPGITAPGHTSRVTVDLTPGTYMIECFMKTPDGSKFHHMLGMLAELTVTDARSTAAEPNATLELTLRNGGMEVPAVVTPGEHTFAVHFAEQQTYDNLGQNDVHLIRVDEDTDLDRVAEWMNAMAADGFTSPTAPAVFLGGIEEMPVNTTAYLTADLPPGRYAWISEVPDPAAKGMLKTFEVAQPR